METYMTRFVRLACLSTALAVFAVAASAEDWNSGQAYVASLDSMARTITLDDRLYHVPASCQIQRESGVRIPLSELRVAIRPGVLLVPMNEVDYVHYEAIQKKRGWEMVEITVLDQGPQ